MWQERCDALWREAEKTNAVVHFGNLVELMDTGKHEHSAQDSQVSFANGSCAARLSV